MRTMPPRKKKPVAATWAERLKALRVRLGITQREAAEKLSVSLSAYIKWENGYREPRGATAKLITIIFPSV